MRSADTIQKLIVDRAHADHRIRAVLLNGSRANLHAKSDPLQDFDVVYIVDDIDSFTSDHNWTNIFGETLILQLPDEMTFGKENSADNKKSPGFSYLMLFEDGNRIDLTLFPKDKMTTDFHIDSLTVIWLDKDNLFSYIGEPGDIDYVIQRPTEKEFLDTCNEFWWVSTYVAKGLLRSEIPYAKEMLETIVRPMFMKVIEWQIGTETDFSVSFGKGGKNMKGYLSMGLYGKILSTYADHQIEKQLEIIVGHGRNIWSVVQGRCGKAQFHLQYPRRNQCKKISPANV
jgi:aminoglycoside 6-adenylyltransferase